MLYEIWHYVHNHNNVPTLMYKSKPEPSESFRSSADYLLLTTCINCVEKYRKKTENRRL